MSKQCSERVYLDKFSKVSKEWEKFYELVDIEPEFGASIDNGFIQTSDIVAKYPTPTDGLISRIHNTIVDYLWEG